MRKHGEQISIDEIMQLIKECQKREDSSLKAYREDKNTEEYITITEDNSRGDK
jgi:hypothetical protein